VISSQVNGGGTYLLTASPVKHTASLPNHDSFDNATPISPGKVWFDDYKRDSQALSVSTTPMRPNRRPENEDLEMAAGINLSSDKPTRRMAMNHLVYKFTSPIGESTVGMSVCRTFTNISV